MIHPTNVSWSYPLLNMWPYHLNLGGMVEGKDQCLYEDNVINKVFLSMQLVDLN
jgi:hypothetical protein